MRLLSSTYHKLFRGGFNLSGGDGRSPESTNMSTLFVIIRSIKELLFVKICVG